MKRSLSKSERLTRVAVDSFFRRGGDRFFVVRDQNFGVFYRENFLGFSRLAVSVGRKYGGSVERNYAKRVVREFWRGSKDVIRVGYDVVFVVYPHGLVYVRARKVLMDLLVKAAILQRDVF